MPKISVEYLVTFILVFFSGFYITGITKFSPIYIFVILAIIIYGCYFVCFPGRFKLYSISFFSVFTCLYIIITQPFAAEVESQHIFNMALPYVIFIILPSLLSNLTTREIVQLAHIHIYINVFLFLVDGIWRILHPSYFEVNEFTGEVMQLGLAYRYKFHSLMYLDSNFVGIQAVCVFFFTLFLYYECDDKKMKRMLQILFLCVLLTTSRAAIITVGIFFLIIRRTRSSKTKIKINFKKLILVLMSTVVLLFIAFFFARNDVSFQSKFWLLQEGFNVYKGLDIKIKMLGIGAGNAKLLLTMGAHNFLVGYILETGIIGFLLVLINFIWISRKSKCYALYVIAPFLMLGFSLTTFAIAYFFVEIALIYVLTERLKKGNAQLNL